MARGPGGGRWVQNMATTRRVGGSRRFPGLGGGHWHRATGAGRLSGNRRCGDGAACARITLEYYAKAKAIRHIKSMGAATQPTNSRKRKRGPRVLCQYQGHPPQQVHHDGRCHSAHEHSPTQRRAPHHPQLLWPRPRVPFPAFKKTPRGVKH
jgi:hypothetical protein